MKQFTVPKEAFDNPYHQKTVPITRTIKIGMDDDLLFNLYMAADASYVSWRSLEDGEDGAKRAVYHFGSVPCCEDSFESTPCTCVLVENDAVAEITKHFPYQGTACRSGHLFE